MAIRNDFALRITNAPLEHALSFTLMPGETLLTLEAAKPSLRTAWAGIPQTDISTRLKQTTMLAAQASVSIALQKYFAGSGLSRDEAAAIYLCTCPDLPMSALLAARLVDPSPLQRQPYLAFLAVLREGHSNLPPPPADANQVVWCAAQGHGIALSLVGMIGRTIKVQCPLSATPRRQDLEAVLSPATPCTLICIASKHARSFTNLSATRAAQAEELLFAGGNLFRVVSVTAASVDPASVHAVVCLEEEDSPLSHLPSSQELAGAQQYSHESLAATIPSFSPANLITPSLPPAAPLTCNTSPRAPSHAATLPPSRNMQALHHAAVLPAHPAPLSLTALLPVNPRAVPAVTPSSSVSAATPSSFLSAVPASRALPVVTATPAAPPISSRVATVPAVLPSSTVPAVPPSSTVLAVPASSALPVVTTAATSVAITPAAPSISRRISTDSKVLGFTTVTAVPASSRFQAAPPVTSPGLSLLNIPTARPVLVGTIPLGTLSTGGFITASRPPVSSAMYHHVTGSSLSSNALPSTTLQDDSVHRDPGPFAALPPSSPVSLPASPFSVHSSDFSSLSSSRAPSPAHSCASPPASLLVGPRESIAQSAVHPTRPADQREKGAALAIAAVMPPSITMVQSPAGLQPAPRKLQMTSRANALGHAAAPAQSDEVAMESFDASGIETTHSEHMPRPSPRQKQSPPVVHASSAQQGAGDTAAVVWPYSCPPARIAASGARVNHDQTTSERTGESEASVKRKQGSVGLAAAVMPPAAGGREDQGSDGSESPPKRRLVEDVASAGDDPGESMLDPGLTDGEEQAALAELSSVLEMPVTFSRSASKRAFSWAEVTLVESKIETVAKVLQKHSTSVVIQNKGLEMLARILTSDLHRCMGGKSNLFACGLQCIVHCVLPAMRTNLDSAAVQSYGCQVLWNFIDLVFSAQAAGAESHDSVHRIEAVDQQSCLESVVAALTAHPSNKGIQLHGCQALACVCGPTLHYDVGFLKSCQETCKQAYVATIASLRTHEDPQVQQQGCRVLLMLSGNEDLNAVSASCSSDAIHMLLTTLDVRSKNLRKSRNRDHQSRIAEAEDALRALANFTPFAIRQGDVSRQTLEHIVQQFMTFMSQHRDSYSMQSIGCLGLSNFSSQSEGPLPHNGAASDILKGSLTRIIKMICAAVQAWRLDADISDMFSNCKETLNLLPNACDALSNLAVRFQPQILSTPELLTACLSAVIDAMNAAISAESDWSSEVLDMGCKCIGVLAEKNGRKIAEDGGLDSVLKALEQKDSAAFENGLKALAVFCKDQSSVELVLAKKCSVPTVAAVLRASANMTAVQQHGLEILKLLTLQVRDQSKARRTDPPLVRSPHVVLFFQTAIVAVIQSLTDHPSNAVVLSSACGVLLELAMEADNEQRIFDAGGIEKVTRALCSAAAICSSDLGALPGALEAELIGICCGALWNICSSKHPLFLAAAVPAYPAIVLAFRKFPKDSVVHENGCGALLTWVNEPNMTGPQLILACGGISSVVEMMKEYPTVDTVQDLWCGVLRDALAPLANPALHLMPSQAADLYDLVLAAQREFPNDATIQSNCNALLVCGFLVAT